MKKWLPMFGDFKEQEEEITFQGGEQVFNNLKTSKCGVILFNDFSLSNGSIDVDVVFDSFDSLDAAEIVFSYNNAENFMCAGITNNTYKYECKQILNNQPFWLNFSGRMENPPGNEYHLSVQLKGSQVKLYINGIEVLEATVREPILTKNVGMWFCSKSTITIKNFTASDQKPIAFIVSQFGGPYDTLYNEVIKPVCEKKNYEPIRCDEMATCNIILSDIILSIRRATVIIADITPDNPNVFYEIGYAHAIKKPTILLCEKSIRDKLPFDVSGFRVVFYNNTIGGKEDVEEKLIKHLNSIVQTEQESRGMNSLFYTP